MNPSTLALLAALAGVTPAPVTAPRPAGTPPAGIAAPDVYVTSPSGSVTTRDAFIRGLMAARLIAVGEKHDEAAHHRVQAEVLDAVAARDPGTVVGLEMVSQDQQAGLDRFLSGAMSEADFAAWWKNAWGFDYSLYKPIFDVARARGLRVVGLNAPIALVSAVAKKGLSGLTPAERAKLPAAIDESSDPRYRDFVKASLEGHKLPPDAMARMLQAQAVWNETMGEKAAELARTSRVVVIAGQGHMFWRAGIPESAMRRGVPSAAVVLAYPLDGEVLPIPDQLKQLRDPKGGELSMADGFVLVP